MFRRLKSDLHLVDSLNLCTHDSNLIRAGSAGGRWEYFLDRMMLRSFFAGRSRMVFVKAGSIVVHVSTLQRTRNAVCADVLHHPNPWETSVAATEKSMRHYVVLETSTSCTIEGVLKRRIKVPFNRRRAMLR